MNTRNGLRPAVLYLIVASTASLLVPASAAYAGDNVNVAISPRAYITWIDTSDYTEVFSIPLAGLSVTFGPASGNWDLTVNGLAGDGDADWSELSDSVWSFIETQSGTADLDRVDYEIMFRYRLQDSPVYIGFGARYIDVEENYIGNSFGLIETDTSEITLGEFAVGFSTQVREGSRHSLFGNLLLGFGTFDYTAEEVFEPLITDDGSAMVIDANVGYQYVVNQTVSFSARYRVIAVTTSGDSDEQDTVQGPELAFTFRF